MKGKYFHEIKAIKCERSNTHCTAKFLDKMQSPVHRQCKCSVHPSCSSFSMREALQFVLRVSISSLGSRFGVAQFLFHIGAFRVHEYTAAVWNIGYSWRTRIVSEVVVCTSGRLTSGSVFRYRYLLPVSAVCFLLLLVCVLPGFHIYNHHCSGL